LFEAFVSTAKAGGTGLGLTIANDIAKSHGGDLSVVSSNRQGTRFRLTLPNA
jgi:signal transduction histidine kinase